MRKILAVIVALLLAVAACTSPATTPTATPSTPTATPTTPAATPTAPPAPTSMATAAATATAIPEPECLEPPPLERHDSTAIRIEGEVGMETTLDAHSLFEVPEAATVFRWEQVFGTPEGVEYLTSHQAEMSGASTVSAAFVPEAPGNYRFRLTATDSAGGIQTQEVDVWVTDEAAQAWEVKGAIFADLWGEQGGPEFDVAQEDSECLAMALDHAYAGPLRVGAE